MKLEIINEAEIIRKRNRYGLSVEHLLKKFNEREGAGNLLSKEERRQKLHSELEDLRIRIDEELSLKFVVVKRGEEIVVKIFHSDHVHYQELEPDNIDSFVGAGMYSPPKIEWDSFSFRDELERDRPENPNEREKILGEVRGSIQEWIGMLIQSNLRKPPTQSTSER